MDIQSAVLNELFVLFPVIIPGWFTPVKPPNIAHGGIPQSLYDGQSKGLECLIDPWIELRLQSWTMAVDDRVELFINDDPTPVTGATVKPGEEALRQRLYIPHGYLRQGVNRLYYKVYRVGGNTSEDSRDLLVLYHLRTPDNLDLVIPPDVIKDGVSADRAAQGVEFGFNYNNRRPYDRIQLLMGDTQVTFDVPDGTAAITHTLFTDTFRAAGNNPSAVIQFLVIDQLGNRSESPEKRLDIHLDRLKLEKPSIKEATNDVLDPLAARNTLTAVIQAYTDMVGTDVKVTWSGTPGEGSHSTAWIRVTAQGTLEISLLNTVVAHNLGGQVTVSYKVKRGGVESDSDGFSMTVRNISNQNPGLPTPAIDGAAGNELNVTTLADTARTRIPKWPFIALGQTLWLRYTGTKADGNIFNHQTYEGDLIPADGLNGMQPRTPVAELAELKNGSTLRVEFKVGFDGSVDEDKAVTFPLKIYTVKAVPKLEVDTTDLELDGLNISIKDSGLPWTETGNDPVGTVAKRPVSGGVPPYTFSSSDKNIASVDAQGTVRSVGNGEATITVRDSAGQSKTYRVVTDNIINYIFKADVSPSQFAEWVRSVGGTSIPYSSLINHLSVLRLKYIATGLPYTIYATNIIRRYQGIADIDVIMWTKPYPLEQWIWGLDSGYGAYDEERLSSICAKIVSPST
ncbi:Ig-like domain-containing protein [Pseudomonas fluorescens]|uniref:BIG2 domain-containing protein n=1 Tax=Pseudomonas fluorescens TaxID=294 RepID=A0A423LM03_PSEFL|nr:Ig-like domain-containing protein [Pseudomonas fluorescens]RON69315.1 hypothetical protein BK671_07710 [Pseudomonas fluorescens]